MLRALCLDLMGTILTDPYREALEAGTGMELSRLAALRDRTAWPDFEMGHIDEAAFIARFFPPGVDDARFDAEAFHRVRLSGYAYLPGVESILAETEGLVERYIASNYPVWITDLLAKFGLDDRVDGVVASCEVGVRKPEPAFYEHLLETVGHPAHACLLVDDRQENCDAAEAAGMRAHLFTDAEDLRARLVAEGLPLGAP